MSLKQAKSSSSGDKTVRQLSPLKCNNLSLTTMEPLFVVPPNLHANASIFGMQTELELLHSRLNSPQHSGRPRAVVICGPPGAGKTYLARQYIWTHRDHYRGGIFWVDATYLESAQRGLDEIAQVLRKGYNVPEPAALANTSTQVVRDYLQLQERWILVFDGLSTLESEEDIKSFTQFLPVGINHGSILYTSTDWTLAKEQQLHEPYLLRVPPLPVEAACKMLFSRLEIRRPTPIQILKASVVARHYEGLPLAIYAVGNYLSSTAKAIERFSPNSRWADTVLAEPFLGVLDRLRSKGHYTALNLMNILCFYNSPIKADLLRLGLQAVHRHVTTNGGKDSLDTALKIMSRYGLVELYHDDNPTGSGSPSGGGTAGHGEDTTVMIKVHTVIRSVWRDQLRTTDLVSPGNDRYISCLLTACEVLHTSYHNAIPNSRDSKNNSTGVGGLENSTKDNYKLHILSLTEHFPKKGSVSSETSQAYGKLIGMNMCIDEGACHCRLQPPSSDFSVYGTSTDYLPVSVNSDSDHGWKIVGNNKGASKQLERKRGGPFESRDPAINQRFTDMEKDEKGFSHHNLRSQTLNSPFPTAEPTSTRTHPSAFMPGELQSPSINRRRTDGTIFDTPRGGSGSSYLTRVVQCDYRRT